MIESCKVCAPRAVRRTMFFCAFVLFFLPSAGESRGDGAPAGDTRLFQAESPLATKIGQPSCPRARAKKPIIIGGPPVESPECKRLRLRLERIQARLRAGYREPKGFRLREQRRSVSDQWLSTCF